MRLHIMGRKMGKKVMGENGPKDCFCCTRKPESLYPFPQDLKVLPSYATFKSAGEDKEIFYESQRPETKTRTSNPNPSAF
jgi:hypothetical protein